MASPEDINEYADALGERSQSMSDYGSFKNYRQVQILLSNYQTAKQEFEALNAASTKNAQDPVLREKTKAAQLKAARLENELRANVASGVFANLQQSRAKPTEQQQTRMRMQMPYKETPEQAAAAGVQDFDPEDIDAVYNALKGKYAPEPELKLEPPAKAAESDWLDKLLNVGQLPAAYYRGKLAKRAEQEGTPPDAKTVAGIPARDIWSEVKSAPLDIFKSAERERMRAGFDEALGVWRGEKPTISEALLKQQADVLKGATPDDYRLAEEQLLTELGRTAPEHEYDVPQPAFDPDDVRDRVLKTRLDSPTYKNEIGDALIEHPYLTEFGITTPTDPLNLVPVTKIPGAVGRGIRGVAKQILPDALQYAGELKHLEPVAPQMASELKIAKNLAEHEIAPGLNEASKITEELRKLKLSKGEEESLRSIRENMIPRDEAFSGLAPKDAARMQKADELLNQFSQASKKVQELKGGQLGAAGVIEPRQYVDESVYIPGYAKRAKNAGIGAEERLASAQGASDKARLGPDAGRAKDIYAPLETELSTLKRTATLKRTYKAIDDVVKRNAPSATFVLKQGEDAATSPELKQTLEQLKQQTGYKWSYIDNEPMLKDFLEATKPAGYKPEGRLELLPEDVLKYMRSSAIYTADKPNEFTKLAKSVSNLANKSFRTAALSTPMYQGGNFVGNQATGLANLGTSWLTEQPAVLKAMVGQNPELVEAAKRAGLRSPLESLDTPTIAEFSYEEALRGAKEGYSGTAVPWLAEGAVRATKGLEKAHKFVDTLSKPGAAMSKKMDEQLKYAIFAKYTNGDYSVPSIARAAEKVYEMAPHLERLSPVEKELATNWVPFYTWQRFLAANSMKVLAEHPNRAAALTRGQQNWERSEAHSAPYGEADLPEWHQGPSSMGVITRGFKDQTPQQQEAALGALRAYQKLPKKDRKFGSEAFAYSTFEHPGIMGIANLEAALKRDVAPQDVVDKLLPTMRASIDAILGGAIVPDWDSLKKVINEDKSIETAARQRVLDTLIGAQAQPVLSRAASYKRIIDIMWEDDPIAAYSFALRMKAGNDLDWWGATLMNKIKGEEVFPVPRFGMRTAIATPGTAGGFEVKEGLEKSKQKALEQQRALPK